MFWCTKNVKFHFRWGTKPRYGKQETGNDCDVISGQADFSVIVLLRATKLPQEMVEKCVIYGCNNTKDEKRGTSVHQIPFFDNQRPEVKKRRQKWIAFVNDTRKNWTASKYLVISSVQFQPFVLWWSEICFFLRCLHIVHTWYRNDTNIIFFQSLLIFLTIIRQTAEIYWCETNRTDHRIFGSDPVLPRGIYKGNPPSPSFLGFWSLIVEKWCLMDRDTSFFNIITPINNALFYHFLAQFLSSQ